MMLKLNRIAVCSGLFLLLFLKAKVHAKCYLQKSLPHNGKAIIQSPSYPEVKPKNPCPRYTAVYTGPPGSTLTLSCTDVDIQCDRNWLNANYLKVEATKKCGKSFPSTTSSDNTLNLQYISRNNYYYSHSYYKRNFKFTCGIKVNSHNVPPSAPPVSADASPSTGWDDGSAKCNCGTRKGRIRVRRVVGGSDTKENEFPYQVSLMSASERHYCGGSLISDEWVVSAAHCDVRMHELVRLGAYKKNEESSYSRTVKISEIKVHGRYDKDTYRYDIVLIKMAEKITFTDYIRPICLPGRFTRLSLSGRIGQLTGWGKTEEGGGSVSILQKVSMNIISNSACKSKSKESKYKSHIYDESICTYTPGKDACTGDSGGPLAYHRGSRSYLIGIISWGIGCGRKNKPAVHTRVSDSKILKWILDVTGIKCKSP